MLPPQRNHQANILKLPRVDGAQSVFGMVLRCMERSSSPIGGMSGAGIEQLYCQLALRKDGLSAAPVNSSL